MKDFRHFKLFRYREEIEEGKGPSKNSPGFFQTLEGALVVNSLPHDGRILAVHQDRVSVPAKIKLHGPL